MTIQRTSMKERIVVSGDGFLFYWNSDLVIIGEVDNMYKKTRANCIKKQLYKFLNFCQLNVAKPKII